jgi:ribosomal protein S15P/S13E
MGQQLKTVAKRRRRVAYLERKKVAAKEALSKPATPRAAKKAA